MFERCELSIRREQRRAVCDVFGVEVFKVAAELGALLIRLEQQRVDVEVFGLLAVRGELSEIFNRRRVVLGVVRRAVEQLKALVAVVRSATGPCELSIRIEQQSVVLRRETRE